MKALGYIAAFVGAAAVGAGVALLVAPETGEELRARVRVKLQEYGILPEDEVDELVEQIAVKLDEETCPPAATEAKA